MTAAASPDVDNRKPDPDGKVAGALKSRWAKMFGSRTEVP